MATSTHPLRQAAAGYTPPGEERPLGAYAGLTAAFALTMTGALGALRASGRELGWV